MSYTCTDVGQLQNFTNIALISLCEDGTTADLIKALEVVGTKLAPFIYHLKPTAGISELIDCCKQFRMDLDDLEGVSRLLVWLYNLPTYNSKRMYPLPGICMFAITGQSNFDQPCMQCF